MSFGYSVGDFIGGYNITYQLIRILSESRGACMEYQEAMTELRGMEEAFLQAGQLVSTKVLSRETMNGIACIVLSSVDIINDFYERSKKYQQQLGGSKAGAADRSWRQVGWTLFKKDELRTLKTQLHERLTSVNTLMTMASYHAHMPTNAAQYEEKPGNSPMDMSAKGNGLSNNVLEWQEGLPVTSESTFVASEQISTPVKITSPDPANSVPVLGHATSIPTSRSPGTGGTKREGESAIISEGVKSDKDGKLDSTLEALEKVIAAFQANEVAKRTKETAPEANIGAKEKAEEAVVKRNREETDWRQDLEEAAYLRAEIKARAAIEAEMKAAAEAKAVEDTKKQEEEAFRQKALQEAMIKAEEMSRKSMGKDKAPIRFKDAVGRKFSFPFHLCQTWTGMEELIKQAFLHVDMIRPHVQAGHYDLLGPNGELILPQVWDKVIEPDWEITMHMWPMDRHGPQKTNSIRARWRAYSASQQPSPVGNAIPKPPSDNRNRWSIAKWPTSTGGHR